MKTIILLLFPFILSAQTYFDISGGAITDYSDNLSFSVGLTQDIYQNVGIRGSYGLVDSTVNSYDVELFTVEATYAFSREAFYSPMISTGVQHMDRGYGTNPLLGLSHLFRIADGANARVGCDTNFNNTYIHGGLVLKVIKADNTPKRFF